MRLARGHEGPIRRRGEAIIPLINVIFLLLVFVMLTMSIGPRAAFDIELPEAVSGLAEGEPDLVLRVAPDGRLALGSEAAALDAVLERIGEEERAFVLIEADRRLPALEALSLVQRLRAVGAGRVDLSLARP
jgi:biopolymer transport protein ExbD